jgi:hypothetical protein
VADHCDRRGLTARPAAPAYFLHDAVTNRSEHGVFDENRELPAMSVDETLTAMAEGTW